MRASRRLHSRADTTCIALSEHVCPTDLEATGSLTGSPVSICFGPCAGNRVRPCSLSGLPPPTRRASASNRRLRCAGGRVEVTGAYPKHGRCRPLDKPNTHTRAHTNMIQGQEQRLRTSPNLGTDGIRRCDVQDKPGQSLSKAGAARKLWSVIVKQVD